MLTKTILIALAGFAVATDMAADVDYVPWCAYDCYGAIMGYLGCEDTDFKCACGSEDKFVGFLQPCTDEYCIADYSRLALSVAGDLCGDVGENPSDEEYASATSQLADNYASSSYYNDDSNFFGTSSSSASSSSSSSSSFSYEVITPEATTLSETVVTSGDLTTTISSVVISVAEAQVTDDGASITTGAAPSASATGSGADGNGDGNGEGAASAAGEARLLHLGTAAFGAAMLAVLVL